MTRRFSPRSFACGVGLAAVLALTPGAGAAPSQAGTLDPSFGRGGLVVVHQGTPGAYAFLENGTILTAWGAATGGFELIRYTRSGKLDRSFGVRGKVVTRFGPSGSDTSANAVAIQPDGKIVVGGTNTYQAACTRRACPADRVDFALARYTRRGTLDRSFGTRGTILTHIPDGGYNVRDGLYALAIQRDGKIVVAGTCTHAGTNQNYGYDSFALARYTTHGTLDPQFGKGGIVTKLGAGASPGDAYSLAIQPDGKIVVGGRIDISLALARYTTRGRLDPSFGFRGVATVSADGTAQEFAESIAIAPDGEIVAAGPRRAPDGTWTHFLLAGFTRNGMLDPNFGTNGEALTPFDAPQGTSVFASSLAIQPDGNIVVAGTLALPSSDGFALARYTPNGTLDPSFGTNGTVTTTLGSPHPNGYPPWWGPLWSGEPQLHLQQNGKIVVAGQFDGYGRSFALARYLGS